MTTTNDSKPDVVVSGSALSEPAPAAHEEVQSTRDLRAIMPKAAKESETSEFSEFVHEYLRHYISLADQKAAFLFAAASAILAYAAGKDALRALGIGPSSVPWTWPGTLGVFAAVALMLSAGFAIFVVAPRLSRGTKEPPGAIFWDDIASRRDALEYAASVRQLSKELASDQIAVHCYTLARICQRKYRVLKLGIWSGVVGFGLTILFIAMK